jgi:hypothetical protein
MCVCGLKRMPIRAKFQRWFENSISVTDNVGVTLTLGCLHGEDTPQARCRLAKNGPSHLLGVLATAATTHKEFEPLGPENSAAT